MNAIAATFDKTQNFCKTVIQSIVFVQSAERIKSTTINGKYNCLQVRLVFGIKRAIDEYKVVVAGIHAWKLTGSRVLCNTLGFYRNQCPGHFVLSIA